MFSKRNGIFKAKTIQKTKLKNEMTSKLDDASMYETRKEIRGKQNYDNTKRFRKRMSKTK